MKPASLFLIAACAFAQTSRIGGTVREIPDRSPIPSVQVTLTVLDGEKATPVATIYTTAAGTYEFRDLKPGSYTVEVAKPGYWWGEIGGRSMTETGGLNTSIEKDGDKAEVELTMLRPATLTGRVENDEGKPVAGLTVALSPGNVPEVAPTTETTDVDGRFAFKMLIPSSYVVRIEPERVFLMALHTFQPEDVAKVEEDYEVSYWPGGANDRKAVLPVHLPPGGHVDIGRLRPKRVSYFRTRIVLRDAECSGDVRLTITEPAKPSVLGFAPHYTFPCADEYLLTGLTGSRYKLEMASRTRWANTEFDAVAETRPVELRFQPLLSIPGRVIAAEGVQLPASFRSRVVLQDDTTFLPHIATLYADRPFTITEATGVPHSIQVDVLMPPYYASSIRYAGREVADATITPVAGASLEIVMDDKPGAIAGTIRGGDADILVYRMRNGRVQEVGPPTFSKDGRFRIANIPPGTYQVMALRESDRLAMRPEEALAGSQSVTVRRGETTSIEFRVPFRVP